ncbi:CoA transferase [uncultured Tateyamaria sp.]|uniref:CaiB/BaiF CoA transferase family protein n=1 Tax=uncultured Tateyamaria sp. TaxID=455651 RepID=UPI002627F7B4|nr:CoA transferase [uncultured Tateyamaria sp.]
MTAPLDGIRVIDWTHVLAGPACAYYLGLLGAEVIKVERPGRGDAMRHRGGTDKARAAAGMSTAYMTQSAGKHSVALDLSTKMGRDVFDRLLRSADILVENHRPDTLARLGLSEAETRAINPRLIHCAMTGYGRSNDMSGAPAYDVNIQAISGLMALTGTKDTGPLRTGAPIIDYATGLTAALATVSALMRRQNTGEGAFVDVSMLETAFSLMSSTLTDFQLTGTEPKARGNAANSRSPSSGVFDCKVGQISLGVNEDAQFHALAHAVDRTDWLTDARFSNAVARDQNGAALGQDIADVLQTRSADDWEQRLMAAGVPCARLRTLAQALDLPPAIQRNMPKRGAAGFTGLPFLMDGMHVPADALPPRTLGTDTNSILNALGYSEQQIAALANAGAIHAPDQQNA